MAISTNTLKPITSIQNTMSKTEKLKYNRVYFNIPNGKFRKLPDFGKSRECKALHSAAYIQPELFQYIEG